MPEQNTPTPIKREDIKAGDTIRQTFEYTAEVDGQHNPGPSTYELIDRPMPLPTAPGIYLDKDGDAWKLTGTVMLCLGEGNYDPKRYAPFTLLRPIPEVAAEVLADVKHEYNTGFNGFENAAANVAAKYGVTS